MSIDTGLVDSVKSAIHKLYPTTRLKKIDVYGVSDEELLFINKKHLEHDYYTDIITFDYSRGNKISGELYVSLERVEENALALGLSYESELTRVVAHGILHLIGFKDKTEEEEKAMRSKEDEVLAYIDKYGS
ncbi:MAG: rRNA maturation RNase YbeY [Schleiferiaceae bacterium]|jgi:rRNA maturation RNase YbeY|nr:rRNA maturation RNase YbeY [Schleiferiaceae bacterium]MDG1312679.1 rRNA maturation RNase YbeY [Schleiferiaceae bacterium]MDG1917865.1 rRNA maturation RNase YbeY [Schleiferiaceae bacterium]